MTRFLARRVLNYVVLLALASFLTFCLTSVAFSPLESLMQRSPRPPQSVIDAKAAELGLNKPIPLRYVQWASHAVRGDFGASVTGHPVSGELWRRIGVSLRLLVVGSVAGTVIGVVLGAWGAIRQYRFSDRVITLLSLLVLSAPTFVIANLLILGALRVNWALGAQLFQYTGETSPAVIDGVGPQLVDRLQHLVLPTLTLTLGTAAGFSRYQRNAMLDVLGQDFIRTARAKGLSRRRALIKHGLRTALIPLATLFAYGVAGLVTGAVFVEKIFGWHGMGEWMVQGVATQDTNIVAAITVFAGTVILLHAADVSALLLHRPGLQRPTTAAELSTLVGHQRTWSGPVGADPAGHAEVDADRGVRGVHLHRHRRDGGRDLGLLRRLARPGTDVVRRPDAGGAVLSADHDFDPAHQEFRQRRCAGAAVGGLRLDGQLADGPRHDHEPART